MALEERVAVLALSTVYRPSALLLIKVKRKESMYDKIT